MKALAGTVGGSVEGATGVFLPLHQSADLSFEQQKEKLLLQMEHEHLKHQAEEEKEFALGKMSCEKVREVRETARITLGCEKLRKGRLSLEAGQGLGGDFL